MESRPTTTHPPTGPGKKAPGVSMLPALLVFPRVELEPVGQKEEPLGWRLEKMALHLNFILHSVRVSQGLCLGWPGAKCVLMVCQHHAGSVETQARDGTVSEAHPQHLAASSSSPRAMWRPHGSQTFQPCTPCTHTVQGQGGTGCHPGQTRGARQPAVNSRGKSLCQQCVTQT